MAARVRDAGGTSSARRRRERRQHSWWRHEQLSVAAALITARHHSAGPGVVTRSEEQQKEVEHETNDGPRAQSTPPPGLRPGVLQDPGPPLVEAVTVGYVAAGVPLLGAPSLADSSAEVIDGSTLSFLLQRALEVKRKEEEEAVESAELVELEEKLAAAEGRLLEVLRQEREGTRVTRHTWSTLSRVEQLAVHAVGKRRVKRKKKKRRRRKLPEAPLPRFGRPCALQRQVPAVLQVLRASGSVPQQNGGHCCCAAETGSHSFLHIPGAVLGQGRCARVAQRQGYGQTVQNAVLVPQLQSIEGRRHPFRAAESDSHGLVWSEDRCSVVDALVVFDMPVVVQRQVVMVQMTSGLSPYSALSLVRQRIHALRQPTELIKKPTHVLREGGLGNFTQFLRVRELGS